MQGSDWVNLFKFPLTIFVAIVTLVIAGLILGIKPSSFHYGDLKVEFEKDLKKEIFLTNLNLQEALKDETRQDSILPEAQTELEEQLYYENTVSDNVAQHSMIQTAQGKQSIFRSVTGYIYIGRFNKITGEFEDIKVSMRNKDIRDIKAGEILMVHNNLVIRENSPVNNVKYFKGEQKVGVTTKGSEVKALDVPEIKSIGDFDEYWVKVEVLE